MLWRSDCPLRTALLASPPPNNMTLLAHFTYQSKGHAIGQADSDHALLDHEANYVKWCDALFEFLQVLTIRI